VPISAVASRKPIAIPDSTKRPFFDINSQAEGQKLAKRGSGSAPVKFIVVVFTWA
jgi:hypothetical protein